MCIVLTLQADNGSILRPPSLIPKSGFRRSSNPIRFVLDLFNDDGLYDAFLNIREPNLMAMKTTRRNYIAFKRLVSNIRLSLLRPFLSS